MIVALLPPCAPSTNTAANTDRAEPSDSNGRTSGKVTTINHSYLNSISNGCRKIDRYRFEGTLGLTKALDIKLISNMWNTVQGKMRWGRQGALGQGWREGNRGWEGGVAVKISRVTLRLQVSADFTVCRGRRMILCVPFCGSKDSSFPLGLLTVFT